MEKNNTVQYSESNMIQPLKQIGNQTASDKMEKTQKESYLKEKRLNTVKLLAKASLVPICLYGFSKYKGYNGSKTAKITIIGSIIIIGAITLNGFSGAWSGTTIMDRTFGEKKYW